MSDARLVREIAQPLTGAADETRTGRNARGSAISCFDHVSCEPQEYGYANLIWTL
jgi:hypothetical protein